MKEYIDRLFDKELDFYLKTTGAVLVVGPKWCGKSTTCKRHAKTIVDLLKTSTREQYISLAKTTPESFLNLGEKPELIDEWQIVSFIWNPLKEQVDTNGEFGQYILTGSVTDKTVDEDKTGSTKEKHTGTGRIIKKIMRTLSLYESGDSNGKVSLTNLKNGIFKPATSDKDINDYAFYICRGGWPLAINVEKDVALQQAKNYYSGLVSEDVFSIKDLPLRRDEQRARKLLRSYSRCISSEASNESIKADLSQNGDSIDKDTFVKYMLVLQRLYVVEELEAWNPNLRSKTAIREKNTRHFVDPSIATAALGVGPSGLFSDMKTFGLLFESLVVRDLRIYCDTLNAKVYHYRDKLEREADAVIQFEDGDWALIEVKLGDDEDVNMAAQKLIELASDINIENKPPVFLMVITKGSLAYKREDGVYVVPLACLKN
jgi:predicted AAA+ superfamily ATPase